MRRITVTSPAFATVQPRPAQDVELVLVDGTGRKVKRRYTIGMPDPTAASGTSTCCSTATGLAPGGARRQPSAIGSAFGPRGRLVLTDADWHLFVGDESALPAISALVEALPPSQRAIALVEVGAVPDESRWRVTCSCAGCTGTAQTPVRRVCWPRRSTS